MIEDFGDFDSDIEKLDSFKLENSKKDDDTYNK